MDFNSSQELAQEVSLWKQKLERTCQEHARRLEEQRCALQTQGILNNFLVCAINNFNNKLTSKNYLLWIKITLIHHIEIVWNFSWNVTLYPQSCRDSIF